MTETFDIAKFVLNMSRDNQLELLESALKQDKFGEFMALADIFLKAPISEGGIPTEEIESVRKKYF
jgi:hypothetical protein